MSTTRNQIGTGIDPCCHTTDSILLQLQFGVIKTIQIRHIIIRAMLMITNIYGGYYIVNQAANPIAKTVTTIQNKHVWSPSRPDFQSSNKSRPPIPPNVSIPHNHRVKIKLLASKRDDMGRLISAGKLSGRVVGVGNAYPRPTGYSTWLERTLYRFHHSVNMALCLDCHAADDLCAVHLVDFETSHGPASSHRPIPKSETKGTAMDRILERGARSEQTRSQSVGPRPATMVESRRVVGGDIDAGI